MIELNNVSCTRGSNKIPILQNISFSIPSGQWVSIAGKNGSGKSTLVRLLNHLLPKDKGEIKIDGLDLKIENIHLIRKKMGIIFSNPDHQFVGQTVADDMIFGLENQSLDRQIMKERLAYYSEKLNIVPLLQRHPSQLSGGQKQRAAIASILAMEPEIVIFDEASSMIDESSKQDIMKIMQDMKNSGKYTIISVTHDVDELMMSDRIIALANGNVISDSDPHLFVRNDELMKKCHLKAPFMLQLNKALLKKGIDIGELLDEQEVVEALWEYNLNKSSTNMVKGAHLKY